MAHQTAKPYDEFAAYLWNRFLGRPTAPLPEKPKPSPPAPEQSRSYPPGTLIPVMQPVEFVDGPTTEPTPMPYRVAQ